jgi:hypothetical protein
MNRPALATMIAAGCTAVAFAAPDAAPSSSPYQGYPKNVARQHYSSNLSIYDASSQSYGSTEAAAAWLDDDVATGWPTLAGKNDYLLQFAEPQLVTNFELSTKNPSGAVSLYIGDSPAAPGDKSWTLVAKDVPVETINQQKLAKPINKYGKYLLIETNIPEPSPIYSVNVYGERSAASTSIINRAQPVDVKTLLGDFVNNQTAFNLASIYAKGEVTFSNEAAPKIAWQRAIDDDPSTFASVNPSTSESGMIVRFDGVQPLTRLSLLANPKARGKIDVFLLSEAPQGATPVSLEGVTPSVTLMFDGTSARGSVDFAETRAAALALRWVPESGDAPFTIREMNVFGDLSLTDHEVAGAPVALAQGPNEPDEKSLADGKSMADGKTLADGKTAGPGIDHKGMSDPPAVALGPGGYLPGSLGFPPNLPRNNPPPTPLSN